MGTSILKKASGFLRKKGKYAAVLAGVLAVTTAGYRMALPGFTLERELVCGLEEHVHTEACFPPLEPETGGETDGIGGGGNPGMDSQPGEGGPTGGGTTEKVLACPFEGKEAHAHTADCYETGKKLTCGQEEGAGAHTHGDGCYTTEKELTCGQEESAGHTHDAACYQAGAELTCGQGESAGHSHGEGCYDENGTATCGQEEGAGGHTHSDACYSSVDRLTCTQTESEGHTHGDGCYTETRGLACGLEESAGHTHGEGCYEEESRLVCGKEEYNPADHVHGDGCYIEAPAAGTEGNGLAGGAAPGGDGEGTGNGTAGGDTQGGGDGTAGSGAEDSAAGSDTEDGTDTESQPICGLEEHTHTDACYGAEVMAVADNIVAYGDWWQLDNEGLLTIKAIDEATAQMPDYYSLGANVPPWNKFKGQIKSVEVEGMNRIGNYAFYGCSQLVEVKLSEGINEIGASAFKNCNGLVRIKLPEGITRIEESVFDRCSNLIEVELPDSITEIGRSAFYRCEKLYKINLPDGVTKIEDLAFSGCSNLTVAELPEGIVSIGASAFSGSIIPEIELGEKVNWVGAKAFASPTFHTLTMRAGHLEADPNGVTPPEKLRNVTVWCDSVDVLSEGVLAWWNSAEVSFEGTGYLSIQGSLSLGHPAKNELSAGEYYADGNGALYLLQEGGASLAYVPAGVQEYRVMGSIPSPDGAAGRPVISVEKDALKMADGLESLVFEDRAGVLSLPDYSCANCPSLASVNGESTVEEVAKTFTNENVRVGGYAFYNTGLEGGALSQDKGVIEFKKGEDNVILSMSTEKKGALPGEEWNWELYTAEQAETTIGLSRPENVTLEYSVVRCYFEFENADGITVYGNGDANSNYEFELVDNKTGISYTVKARRTGNPYIYYYEIPMPNEGGTLTLRLPSWYPSPASGGGSVKIWPVLLTAEQNQALGNGVAEEEIGFHQVDWVTKEDEFPVTKTKYGSAYIQGDGMDGGNLYVKDLAYRITMSRSGETLEGKGKDYMLSADFTDTLKLPDGMRWREDVLEAVEDGRCFYDLSDYSSNLYVKVGNTPILLCQNRNWSNSLSMVNPKAAVVKGEDGKKELAITWRINSKDTTKEITPCNWTISFGGEVILVEIPENGEALPAKYTVKNEVKAVQHFSHSGDQYKDASADAPVSVAAGNCKVKKTADYRSKPSAEQTWGNGFNYTITLQNTGVAPYRNLTSVKDTLSSYLYIRPTDMAEMIHEAEGMPGVERLEIAIDSASLCQSGLEGDGCRPGQEVTGTDGRTYTLTWQDTGVGTEYGPLTDDAAGRDPADPAKARLAIVWEKGGGIHLEVSSAGGSQPAGLVSAEGIGSALEGIGYLVTSDVAYTVTWGLEDYVLYSGAAKNFRIPVTVKDSFMLLDQDVLEKRSEERFQLQNNTAIVSEAVGEGERTHTDTYRTSSYDDITYRDYTLQKGVMKNGEEVGEDKDSVVPGEVLTYTLEVSHRANPLRGIVPLVDRMKGAQALLAPAEGNGMLEDRGLDKVEVSGKEYYLLSKEGVYYGVTLGEGATRGLTHSITVERQGNGELDTLIRWYLAGIQGEGTRRIDYHAYVVPSLGGDGGFFELSNQSWLNDHQSHRLYDDVGIRGTNVTIEKMIVSSRGEGGDPGKDILEEYSQVHKGDITTYRLKIENSGEGRVIEGRQLYDVLPQGYSWQRGDVGIEYLPARDGAYTLEGGDDWDVVDGEDGLRHIAWGENFKLALDGDIYIYVTLKWPEGEAWEEYARGYGAKRLENKFWCYQLWDMVTHDMVGETRAYLQKGVYSSAAGQGLSMDDENRLYYENDKTVTYYAFLYNGGYTRMYLDELHDRLPRGFGVTTGKPKVINGSTFKIMDAGGNVIEPVWLKGEVSYKKSDGNKVILKLTGREEEGWLQYDERYQMYYLSPGEAICFTYTGIAGAYYKSTDDIAPNCIAMAYTDLGGGVEVMDVKAEGPDGVNKDALKNDGGCSLLTNQEAEEMGFTGGEDNTQWLASKVNVKRGEIIPGITKKVAGIMSDNGSPLPNNGYADAGDTIQWAITATNSGRASIIDYTITDAMEKPYSYTGMVSYEIDSGDRKISSDLFRIKESTREDGKLCLTLESLKNNNNSWMWILNGVNNSRPTLELQEGDNVEISFKVFSNGYIYNWAFGVGLSDKEELILHCIRGMDIELD